MYLAVDLDGVENKEKDYELTDRKRWRWKACSVCVRERLVLVVGMEFRKKQLLTKNRLKVVDAELFL